MLRHFITPNDVAKPVANYSHAVEVAPEGRWLVLSGQIGVRPDGSIPDDVAEQAEVIFDNIIKILAEAHMAAENIVRISCYLTDLDQRSIYMEVRDRYVADPPPASTLLVVRALARPELKLEVEILAAADS